MHLLALLIICLTFSGITSSEAVRAPSYSIRGISRNQQSGQKKKKVSKSPRQTKKVRKTSARKPVQARPKSKKTRQTLPAAKRNRTIVSTKKRKPVVKKVPLPVSRRLAIMGSRYATIPTLDGQLSGTVYYLASGHGGPDPGAIGKYGKQRLPEDEYAYDVTLRLARLLIQHGAAVYMIVQDRNDGIRDVAVLPIDYDEVAYPNQAIPLNQTSRLRQTTTAVNSEYARHKGRYQRFVTIHVDSRSKGETTDVFFYHHPQSKVGLRLARHIHKTFLANYRRHRPARPYMGRVSSRGSLYVVKNSHPPTVFIELGNIQNSLDQRRFLIPQNRQALANWMCQGILTDYRTR